MLELTLITDHLDIVFTALTRAEWTTPARLVRRWFSRG